MSDLHEWDNALDAWLDGEATSQELATLNKSLCISDPAAREFAREISLHYALREAYLNDADISVAIQFLNSSDDPEASKVLLKNRESWPFKFLSAVKYQGISGAAARPRGLSLLLIALIVVVPVLIWGGLGLRKSSMQTAVHRETPVKQEIVLPDQRRHEISGGTERAVASISRSANVSWSKNSRRWSVGERIGPGEKILLDQGRVQLDFDHSAVVILAGPAELEIRSPDLLMLRRGTITTRVDSSRTPNFRVLTPTTEVIDLGTEFGVRVNQEGETDVVVFEGMVDVISSVKQPAEKAVRLQLQLGEATRIGKSGDCRSLYAIRDGSFPAIEHPYPASAQRDPVILDVIDDRRDPFTSYKYYRICHHAFDEDCLAYVDRQHQWNGMTSKGIPDFLRGADYIATFNDDKSESPTITVSLGQPATLYLFVDKRVPPPEWLTSEFRKTGFEIGLDEGSYVNGLVQVEAGPGNSIDEVHSIWSREVLEPGTVTIGSIINNTSRTSMLGIAAQPLKIERKITLSESPAEE